jgi:hypothetical protein
MVSYKKNFTSKTHVKIKKYMLSQVLWHPESLHGVSKKIEPKYRMLLRITEKSSTFREIVIKQTPRELQNLFELGRRASLGRQTGIRLYRPVPAEGQNKSWRHRLTAKAITYQERHLNNKEASPCA